jgi:hypothetical protein
MLSTSDLRNAHILPRRKVYVAEKLPESRSNLERRSHCASHFLFLCIIAFSDDKAQMLNEFNRRRPVEHASGFLTRLHLLDTIFVIFAGRDRCNPLSLLMGTC